MPIITIARGSMWGGQAVAKGVSEALGCQCIGRETLTEEALRLALGAEGLPGKPDQEPWLWDRLASERATYLSALQAALASYAGSGSLVYHGNAGHLLLRGMPSILRVRIIAPLEVRIGVVREKSGISRDDAETYIKRVDEEWARWTRFIFGVEWRDPSLYDLVINLENFSIDGACCCVLDAAKRTEFTVTEEVKGRLQDLALAARVRLALAMNPASRDLDLEVRAEKGVVCLAGSMIEPGLPGQVFRQLKQMVETIVGEVPGVLVLHLGPDGGSAEPHGEAASST
jgi:cytidylate kinase